MSHRRPAGYYFLEGRPNHKILYSSKHTMCKLCILFFYFFYFFFFCQEILYCRVGEGESRERKRRGERESRERKNLSFVF
jgi:hypothetical protein